MVYLDKERLKNYESDFIHTLGQIEKLLELPEQEFLSELKTCYSLRYLIILTVEVMANIGKHLLARIAVKPVEEYKECFLEMRRQGFLAESIATPLVRLAGLRNLLVHRYWEVDDRRIYHECKENMPNLYKFSAEVKIIEQKYPDSPLPNN